MAKLSLNKTEELEEVRVHTRHHLQKHKCIDGLSIDAKAPEHGTKFAFIASAPKLVSKSRENWYRCSYCEVDNKFMDGKIVYCEDKKLRLIGEDCWKRHIADDEWHGAKDEYRQFERKEKFKSLSVEYPQALKDINDSLKLVLAAPKTWDFVDRYPVEFERRMSSLWRQLQIARSRDGRLSVLRRVVDYQAIERGGSGSGKKIQEFTLHRVMGVEALSRSPMKAKRFLESGQQKLWHAKKILVDTKWGDLTNHSFSGKIKEFEALCFEGAELIEDACDLIKEVLEFFSQRNLSGIVLWANDPDCELSTEGTYELVANGLRFRGQTSDCEINVPHGIGIQVEGLGHLNRLLRKS
ncbi:hypothetical protein [Thalassospira profundimaris]|uniref:hypothetical protein n=1 Tax=Thalassospira profundimaris TaxID=502049 RepID=UPI0002873147|nr:hypothetical protein [Thalassospira profundimaris]EKF07879.1 hypothetical protein TH2_13062 [Thalassospira profundimaris WP0211]